MRIFLTGASGFLGTNFIRVFENRFTIIAIYNNNKPIFNGTTQKLDISNLTELKKSLEVHKPDVVFHLAASSQPNFCELNPEESYKNNVSSVKNLIEACSPLSIPIVFTSTDLVFDGINPPYSESDKVNPLMIYGKHKVDSENLLIKYYQANSVICRMPLMYDNPEIHKGSFISGILDNLRSRKQVNLFEDEFRTIVSAQDACVGLMLSFERSLGKIIHLGGVERLSRTEIGYQICDTLNLDRNLIINTKQKEVQMPAPRPKDVSLNSEFAYSLGFKPRTLTQNLQNYFLA